MSTQLMLATGAAAVAGGAYLYFVGFGSESQSPPAGDAKGLGLVAKEVSRSLGDAKEAVARLAAGDVKGAVHGAEHTVENSLPGRKVRQTVTKAERVPVAGFGAYEAKKSYQLGKRGVDKIMSGNVLSGAGDLVAASPVGTAYRAVFDLFTGQRGKDEAARQRQLWGDLRTQLNNDLAAHRSSMSAEAYNKEKTYIRYVDRAFKNVAKEHGGPLWFMQHRDDAVHEMHVAAEKIAAKEKAEAERRATLEAKAAAERKKIEDHARAVLAEQQAALEAAKKRLHNQANLAVATKNVLARHGGMLWAMTNETKFKQEVAAELNKI